MSRRAQRPQPMAAHRSRKLAGLSALLIAGVALYVGTEARPATSSQASRAEGRERWSARAPERVEASNGATDQRAPSASGKVRAASGEPIAGASVCASCTYPQCGEPGVPLLHCATTANDGGYTLEELASGLRYRMLATAAGYRPAGPRESDLRNPWLVLGASPQHVDFVLERGGAQIVGRVLDAYGGTIAGAVVAASDVEGGFGSTTLSDDDGRFALALGEGSWSVRASAPGYDSSGALLLAPSEGAELVLAAAGSMKGRVVSAIDGAPIAGVEVRATKHARLLLAPGDGSAISDAAGNFAIASLGAGDYELIARGARWYGSESARRQLAIGEHMTGIELRVRPASIVEGRVLLDPGDEPCAQGNIYFATAAPAGPSEDGFATFAPIVGGAVVIEGVPAGEYRVQVTCQGYLARAEYERVRVNAADVRGLRWPVTRGLRVAGQLVDAAGRPVAGRRVQASPEAATEGYAQAVTGARGEFELSGLGPTRYTIAPEAASESAQMIDLSHGRTLRSPLRLELRAVATIEVQLRPSAAGAVVQAIGPEAERTALRVSAERFELRDLPAGDYRIYASDGRNRPVEQRATAVLGARTRVNLVLPAASAVLRGQVFDRRGAPVADAWVTATPNRTPSLPGPLLKSAVLTEADGSFVIPNLIAGDQYNLQAEHQTDGSASLIDAVPGVSVALRLMGPS